MICPNCNEVELELKYNDRGDIYICKKCCYAYELVWCGSFSKGFEFD